MRDCDFLGFFSFVTIAKTLLQKGLLNAGLRLSLYDNGLLLSFLLLQKGLLNAGLRLKAACLVTTTSTFLLQKGLLNAGLRPIVDGTHVCAAKLTVAKRPAKCGIATL